MQSTLKISTTAPLAGAVMVGAINNALESMATRNSGTEAPAVTYSFMQYADTTKGVLLRRNAANTGDILEGTLAETLVQARAANTMLLQADHLTTIIATGTFTQTFDAAATLGDGWSLMYRNNGTGTITLDPSGSETIDGATTVVLPAGSACVIACDGTGFYTFGRASAGGNLTGAINTAAFSVAAHATTCDIWTGGNVCTLTGSATTFTDVADAPQAGATRIVKCNAAHVFTDNANMDVAGGTFTAAAGDWLLFEAVTTSTFKVTPFKGDGTAVAVTRRVGELIDWAGNTTPSYALLCDGSAVSRTLYADLFAKIGTLHGAGDGSTTFNLPNIPADYTTSQASGGNEGTATTGQVIAHTHSTAFSGTGGGTGGTDYLTSSSGGGSRVTTSTGGAANLAAALRVRKCIIF